MTFNFKKCARRVSTLAVALTLCFASASAFQGDIAPVTGASVEGSAPSSAAAPVTGATTINSVTSTLSSEGTVRSADQIDAAASAQQAAEEQAAAEKAAAKQAAEQAAKKAAKAAEQQRLDTITSPSTSSLVRYSSSIVATSDMKSRSVPMGTYRLTFYCPCSKCSGVWAGGATSSGARATEGRTIAVDTSRIPIGSRVFIEGFGEFVAEDVGSAIRGNKIDIYLNSHERCLQLGVRKADVYLMK